MRSSSGTRRSIAFLFAVLALAFAARPALAQSWGSSGFTLTPAPSGCSIWYTGEAPISSVGHVAVSCLDGSGYLRAGIWDGKSSPTIFGPPGTNSLGFGISATDQVVGEQTTGPVLTGTPQAFLYNYDGAGAFQSLSSTPESELIGINDAGQAVGFDGTKAVLYQGGVSQDLGTFGGSFAEARGINAAGTIVGFATTPDGYNHPFLDNGAGLTPLGAPGTVGGAYAVNNAGVAIGEIPGAGAIQAALFDGTSTQALRALYASFGSWAFGISDGGYIAGYSFDPSVTITTADPYAGWVGTLWDGGVAYNLNNIVDPHYSGWNFVSATIGFDGTIVATGYHNSGPLQDVLLKPNAATVTPEPASVLLLATGLIGLLSFGAVRRRHHLDAA